RALGSARGDDIAAPAASAAPGTGRCASISASPAHDVARLLALLPAPGITGSGAMDPGARARATPTARRVPALRTNRERRGGLSADLKRPGSSRNRLPGSLRDGRNGA